MAARSLLLALPILLFALAGCEQPAATPFPVNRTFAVWGGRYVTVYFVADSDNVIRLALPSPDTKISNKAYRIGKKREVLATLCTGPDVLEAVTPSGPAPPPPKDPDALPYQEATDGRVTYSFTPPRNTYRGPAPWNRPELTKNREPSVTVTVHWVRFGNVVYAMDEVSLTAYPPPP